jgi:hypothetical protein
MLSRRALYIVALLESSSTYPGQQTIGQTDREARVTEPCIVRPASRNVDIYSL